VLRVADCSNSGSRPVLWLRFRNKRWRACCALRGVAADPLGATLERTIVTSRPINAGGYRRLTYGRGEPHLVPDDVGIAAHKGRCSCRRSLLALAQFTDLQIQNSQSPAGTRRILGDQHSLAL
jgi:hypothetical protein